MCSGNSWGCGFQRCSQPRCTSKRACSPAACYETMHRERISLLAAVPRVLVLLKTHLEAGRPGLAAELNRAQGASIARRWWRFRGVHRAFGLKFWAFVCGGASLPTELEQFWRTLGFVVVQGYGMTETSALITLNHPFRTGQGTIGKPLPGREIRIRDDGEILVRGDMVSSATWQGGRLRQRSDPWLATGDLVTQDETGQLRFVGRKSEVIVTSAGLNVHPEDVEVALKRQPGVEEAVVFAFETAAGTEPAAVLLFRGDAGSAQAAVVAANANLAEYQRIRRWAVWPGAGFAPQCDRQDTTSQRGPVVCRAAGARSADGSVAAIRCCS